MNQQAEVRFSKKIKIECLLKKSFKDSLCGVCRASVQTILTMRRIGATQNALRNFVMTLCTGFNIVPDYVCSGVIDLNIVSIPSRGRHFVFFLYLKLISK